MSRIWLDIGADGAHFSLVSDEVLYHETYKPWTINKFYEIHHDVVNKNLEKRPQYLKGCMEFPLTFFSILQYNRAKKQYNKWPDDGGVLQTDSHILKKGK